MQIMGNSNLSAHIHPGFQRHSLPGHGVYELQPFGAEHLVLESQLPGKPPGVFVSILGIAQYGKSSICTVHPQLMGPASYGPQFKFT